MPSSYKAAQVTASGVIELVDRPLSVPGAGEVCIRVEACGVCHSDSLAVDGNLPVEYPRVPGHEVAGIIDAINILFNELSITGTVTALPIDREDTLEFAAAQDICANTEIMPLAEAPAAYARMMRNEARFRIVLTP